MNNLLLAFYGDDFTGSTDALEFLSLAGAKTALFIEPPTFEQLKNYPDLNAIGVAGLTRSMPPNEMENVLVPAFNNLKELGVRHVHYKVCSTFDSSPKIGSIGKAIDVGSTIFNYPFVPLLVAAPALGRYCLFGNLFARMGIGSNGNIYRLDRHPSMSKHPTTPADESDLRLHLSKQTNKKIGLIDILQIEKPIPELKEIIDQQITGQSEVILIDAVYESQLLNIGELIDNQAIDGHPLFSVGSSGIEMALGNYWQTQQKMQPVLSWPNPGKASPLLVISGSCSPVTAAQIAWAKVNNFEEVIIDANEICDSNNNISDIEMAVKLAVQFISNNKSVIVHTNGTADNNTSQQNLSPEKLGTALGLIAREVAAQTTIKRIVIAGGDTSSYAARAMGIEAVIMIAPLVKGAPLCKATAPNSSINGMEVNFKGGQVGGENYFGILLEGGI